MVPMRLSAGFSMPSFCMSLSCNDMMMVMSFSVASGMYMWITKALAVAESVEYTPVRYRFSMISGEWFYESGAKASGLWRSRRRDGYCRYMQSLSSSPLLQAAG